MGHRRRWCPAPGRGRVSTTSVGGGRRPVPFTVIGGFLGAGKTTLLNHVLRHTTERIAVVVNDFGATPIDADLVADHDGDTIALANGCVCCSIAGELALTLVSLLDAEPPFDRVITEASGIADPRAIAQYGTTPGFRLDGVIVVADACTLTTTLGDERIATQVATQLARADVVILNKVDAAGDEQLAAATEVLAQRHPTVPVLHAVRGAVPLPLLLDLDADRLRTAGAGEAGVETAGVEMAGVETAGVETAGASHGFDTLTIRTDRPVGRVEVAEIVGAFPPAVLRAKGIVTDESGGRWVVHRVGRTVRVTAAPAGGVQSGGTRARADRTGGRSRRVPATGAVRGGRRRVSRRVSPRARRSAASARRAVRQSRWVPASAALRPSRSSDPNTTREPVAT